MAEALHSSRRIGILAIGTWMMAVVVFYGANQLYPPDIRDEVRVVVPADLVRLASLGQVGFVADVLLARITIHSGSLMWKPLDINYDSPWAYGTVDVITDLDPRFFMAYLYSAMGMIHNFDDVHRARPIVEKGMAIFPDNWELPFWVGYNYYAYFHDYDTAAEYLWKAYKAPDAPQTFLSLMLSTLRHAGDYEKARVVIEQMYNEATDDGLKMVYAKRMIQLENLILLQHAARIYRQVRGTYPASLEVMVTEGLLPELPEDPFGLPYVLDTETEALVILGKR